jgi:hypothetical protein
MSSTASGSTSTCGSSAYRDEQSFRFRARRTALSNDADAERLFKHAAALFRELAIPYLAVTELEHAEWFAAQGRGDQAEPLLTEARETSNDSTLSP